MKKTVFLILAALNTLYSDMIYKYENLNKEHYQQVAHDREYEHQIGRFINFKKIISKCKKLNGDFIEFGTLSGFSLMWIAHIAEQKQLFNKKIIGLDGFVGLPYGDGGFVAGDFKTTEEVCLENLKSHSQYYPKNYSNIRLGKFLFKEKEGILNFLKQNNASKFCFIHIDCDVSQSAIEIFELLGAGNLIADEAFIAFDDYYCDSSLRYTVPQIFESFKQSWDIQPYSKTNLTQTFLFKKR